MDKKNTKIPVNNKHGSNTRTSEKSDISPFKRNSVSTEKSEEPLQLNDEHL